MKRIRIFLVVVLASLGLGAAIPAAADAHFLYVSEAKSALWGNNPNDANWPGDNDMRDKAECLEWQYGWNLVSWWISDSGHLNGDDHFVVSIGNFKRANGVVVQRAFDSRLYDGSNTIHDYPETSSGACPY